MAKRKKSMAEVFYGQSKPAEPAKRKGEPDKRTPAEKLGKLVPIFGRLADAFGGSKPDDKKKKKKR